MSVELSENQALEDYHLVWIKYFTMECNLTSLKTNQKTEVDFFLDEFKYSPFSITEVKRELSTCKNSDEATQKLSSIFHFKDFLVLNSCILAQICMSANTIKSENEACVPQTVFRGFIVFTYLLPEALLHEMNGESHICFQDQYWQVILYVIQYLILFDSETYFTDLSILLEPVKNCLIKSKQVLTLPKNNKAYIFIMKMIELFIPHFNTFISCGNWSYIEFCLEILSLWTQCRNEIDHDDPFVEDLIIFFQTVSSFINEIPPNITSKISVFASCFITRFCCPGITPTNCDISICVSCITILKRTETFTNEMSSILAGRALLTFLRWSLKASDIDEEFTDLKPIVVQKEPLVPQTANEYFESHQFLSMSVYKKLKASGIVQSIYQTVIKFMSTVLPVTSSCLDGFEDLPYFGEDTYMPAMIIILASLTNVKEIKLSDSLKNFITMVLTDPHFSKSLKNEEDPLSVKYQNLALLFCIKFATSGPSECKALFSIIARIIKPDNFEVVSIFFPFFRTIITFNQKFSYIQAFVNSGILDVIHPYLLKDTYQQQIDEFAALCALIVQMDPVLVFTTFSIISMITELVTKQRYQKMLIPCFKTGFMYADRTQFETCISIIDTITSQISALIISSISNNDLLPSSAQLLQYFNESLPSFPADVVLAFENNSFFDCAANTAAATHDANFIIILLKTLTSFCIKYPQFIEKINSKSSTVQISLRKAFSGIKPLTLDLVNAVISLACNEEITINTATNKSIHNRQAIVLLLEIVDGTEFEKSAINAIIDLCKSSSSNSFECFHCDIIRCCLDKCDNMELLPLSLSLYSTISSIIFSPLAMNETFRALYFGETRSNKQQAILDCLINMISLGNPSPVTSFFHLNGIYDGIIGPEIDSSIIMSPWAFATTLRIDRSLSSTVPLVSFIESTGSLSLVFGGDGELKVIRNEGDKINASSFKYKFRRQIWYHIIIGYSNNTITLYVNEQKTESVHFSIKMSGQLLMRLGNSENMFLAGDLGPTYIFCTDDIKEVFTEFSKSLHSLGKLKNAVVSLHPCMVQQGKINNAVMSTSDGHSDKSKISENPIIMGTAVPYCTTINDVMKLDGSLFTFLPLFSTINKEYIGENEDHTLNSLIIALRLLLSISLDTQVFFESVGGFKLLAGFFGHIDPCLFNKSIANELSEIYKVLVIDTLKSQMVEYIWLNFNMMSRMPFDFQKAFFSAALPCVYNIDSITEGSSFQFDSYDFLLYQCQTPLLLENVADEEEEETVISSSFDDSYTKKFTVNENIIEEQKNAIKGYQWTFFSEMLHKSISSSTFLILYMIFTFNEDTNVRLSAFSIFEKYIGERHPDMIVALTILNGYECFIPLMKSDIYEIQIHVINCLYLIASLEKEGIFQGETSLYQAIIKITLIWNSNVQFIPDLCKSLIFFSIDNRKTAELHQDLVYPEFLLLCISMLPFIDEKEIVEKEMGTVVSDIKDILLNSSNIPLKDHGIWCYYLFMLFSFAYGSNWTEENIEEIVDIISTMIAVGFDVNKIETFSVFSITLSLVIDFDFDSIFESALCCATKKLLQSKANSLIVNVSSEELYKLTAKIIKIYLFDLIIDTPGQMPFKKFSVEEFSKIREIFYNSSLDANINQDFNFVYSSENEGKKPIDHGFQILELLLSIISSKIDTCIQITSTLSMYPIEIFSLILARMLIEAKDDIEIYDKLFDFANLLFVAYDSRQNFITEDTKKNTISYVIYGSSVNESLEIKEIIRNKFKGEFNEEEAKEIYLKTKERLEKEATQMVIDYKPLFVSIRAKIGNDIHNSIDLSETLSTTYHNSYNSFIKVYQKKRILVEHHNHKLASSFIREATSNGGPLSNELVEQKWKVTTSFDKTLRNVFMKVNHNYDDHRQASMLRDSNESEKTEQHIFIPFKRVLDQDMSFAIFHDANKSKGRVTFITTLLTVSSRFDGKILLNSDRLIFDGMTIVDVFGNKTDDVMKEHKFLEIKLNDIEFIFLRRELHEQVGCEIFTNFDKSYLFYFASEDRKNAFLETIQKLYDENKVKERLNSIETKAIPNAKQRRRTSFPIKSTQTPENTVHNPAYDFFESARAACNGIYQNHSPEELVSRMKIVDQWQQRNISTFTYLMCLNIIGGRSFNDLSKYPIFPWVLSCYNEDEIDLNDPSCYRDFTKPIGAMNESRLEHLKMLDNDMFDPYQKCLYRSHYSNPATVIGFMIREEPFSTLHIALQEGRYDHADRLFSTIGGAWSSVTGTSNDFRELIPEFYCNHHFLCNENNFDLGCVLGGVSINEVKLPKWARTPYEFISLHRKALESEIVSQNINNWIDLIFGVYRRSMEHDNVFHLFSYSDIVMQMKQKNNGEGIDEGTMALARHHCANFGCCPEKLFSNPHPRRRPNLTTSGSNPRLGLPPKIQNLSNPNLKSKTSLFIKDEEKQFSNNILCIEDGFVLTTNEIYNVKKGTTTKFTPSFYPSKRYLFCSLIVKRSIVITVLQGSSFATVTNFLVDGNQNAFCSEEATLAHKGSIILCAANVDDDYFVTGGSDCAINIFAMGTWKLIATLPFHTLPITCIGGNSTLGLVVSIDEAHQVFCSSITTKRFINAFALDCSSTSEHKLLVLDSGLIAITSIDKEGLSKLDIFDTRGVLLKRILINSAASLAKSVGASVTSLFAVPTTYSVPYICISTRSRYIIIVDGCTLEPIKTSMETIIPELVSPAHTLNQDSNDSRTIYVIKTNRTLSVYEF